MQKILHCVINKRLFYVKMLQNSQLKDLNKLIIPAHKFQIMATIFQVGSSALFISLNLTLNVNLICCSPFSLLVSVIRLLCELNFVLLMAKILICNKFQTNLQKHVKTFLVLNSTEQPCVP